jgi:hypothetical protein
VDQSSSAKEVQVEVEFDTGNQVSKDIRTEK